MQIFELHFNPKLNEEQIIDSFVYEPENVYEKKLGSLYMVGELQNALPQNLNFLDNLAKVIKKNYYNLSLKSPEKALAQCLKKTNEFLADQVKKENVSWLGNLNFAVLSLTDSNLTFTKTGDLKIFLIRAGQINDIGSRLELREIEPYPVKIFLNTVSGKLAQDDIILVLTKEVFEFFQEENLLTKLSQTEELDSKNIKKLLPTTPKISGICFLARLRPPAAGFGGQARPILLQKEKKLYLPKFSLPKLSLPKLPLPKISLPKFPKLNPVKFASQLFNRVKLPPLSRLKIPKIKIPKLKRKKITLIVILIFVLLLGFLIFKRAEQRKEGELKKTLAQIEEKVNQAENFLIFKEEEKANSLFQEAWQELSVLNLAPDLKQKVEENLKKLNHLENIEEPEIGKFFPAQPENITYLSNVYFLDKETCEVIKSGQKWMKDKGPCANPKSMAIDGSIWILNGDNSILRYYAGTWQETIELDFFPLPGNITKIKTGPDLPYLYLLEPVKNRIIITDKTGKIVKQFQSPKFDNLTDFAISENGKTIYLLNNSTTYKIEM